MAPPTTSDSATTAGKTWAEIEAGPDPWGHPLDYRTMKRVMGLNSPCRHPPTPRSHIYSRLARRLASLFMVGR